MTIKTSRRGADTPPPKKLDSTGRVTFTVRTQDYTPLDNPTPAQLEALEFIHRHTLCASNILYELFRTRVGYKHYTNFYDRILRRLYDADLIERPKAQQFTIGGAERNYHVYTLSERGVRLLQSEGRYEPVVKHSGMFPHQLMGATYTATIDIMCQREGYTFIPAHEYLKDNKKKVYVPFTWDGKEITDKLYTALDPDYLFGIQYDDGTYIAYMPEFNRDTEPYEPRSYKRRSDLKSIRQLSRFIGKKDYQKAYGRTAQLVYVHVTVNEEAAERFIDLTRRELGKVPYIASTVMPTFESPFRPPKFPQYLFDEPMLRAKTHKVMRKFRNKKTGEIVEREVERMHGFTIKKLTK